MLRLVIFLILLSTTLNGEPYENPCLSPQLFKGTILSIQRYNYVNKPVPYMQVIFLFEHAQYTVNLGPEPLIQSEGLILLPGDEIEIWGIVEKKEKKLILHPCKVKKNQYEVNINQKN